MSISPISGGVSGAGAVYAPRSVSTATAASPTPSQVSEPNAGNDHDSDDGGAPVTAVGTPTAAQAQAIYSQNAQQTQGA